MRGSCTCEYGPVVEPPLEEDSPNVVSFDIGESVEALDLDGIRNASSTEIIDQCEQELIETAGLTVQQTSSMSELEKVDWKRLYGSDYNVGKGFVGSKPATGPASIMVRQEPNILAVYGALFGDARLYPTTDRYGLMRPTAAHPEWATETGFVHWDQNPTREPDFCRIQAVLTLSEHTPTSGGFHCVPGSHLWFKRYGQDKQCPAGSLVGVEGECVVSNHLYRIPATRGSLIIWDSRTAHGNWPNQLSDEWRKVLYMTYFVRPQGERERQMYSRHFGALLGADPRSREVLTEAGEKLFAQQEY